MFPAPIRAACAQVWLVPTSVRPLRTLERATAAWRGGGEVQEAACGGSKSRDSCDSDAFARPRARRALTGLQGLDARPCPTPPGPSAGSVAGSCAALVTVCCGRKVALFTLLHGGHVAWSNCDFRVLSGPGELYYVPIVCTNTSRRPAELFPDLHESSRSDFGRHCNELENRRMRQKPRSKIYA